MYGSYDLSPYARDVENSLTSVDQVAILSVFGTMLAVYMFIILAIAIVQVIAMWKVFSKAGEKGWKSIIPIYNVVILFKISGLSPWLIFVYFAAIIPFIGWIACVGLTVYLAYCLSKSFGKDIGYAIGLWLLAPIFYMILGFGNSQYVGPYGKNKNTVVERQKSE